MRCEVADEPVVVLKSRPLKPGNGVEDINRDDLIFNDQGARSSKVNLYPRRGEVVSEVQIRNQKSNHEDTSYLTR